MARVLVVDDDDLLREALCAVLDDAGYSVHVAADGQAALTVLRAAHEPTLVLLDVVMPRLGGIGVLQAAARDRGLMHRHAFVLVTAIPDWTRRTYGELLETLAVPVVPKPLDVSLLLDTVQDVVRTLNS